MRRNPPCFHTNHLDSTQLGADGDIFEKFEASFQVHTTGLDVHRRTPRTDRLREVPTARISYSKEI